MNYRKIIKENRRKTVIALTIYLVMYVTIGILLDIIVLNQGSFLESINKIINLKVFPIATVSMLAVAIVSVFVSIFFFKRIQLSGDPYTVVTEDSTEYRGLYNIVEELKIAARMDHMPQIYIIEAPYLNAFASGWSSGNTMVAVTRGLYDRLNRAELAAVMAHEITHIRNEDIKLTLVVGVVTNIMLFATDFIVYMFLRGNRSEGAQTARTILLVLHFVLPILTIAVQMWLSRSREYMADSGAVELIRDPVAMASALKKISGSYDRDMESLDTNKTRRASYIFEPSDSIFSTHPSVKNRIKKLTGEIF